LVKFDRTPRHAFLDSSQGSPVIICRNFAHGGVYDERNFR
jgi:hypothetical protein